MSAGSVEALYEKLSPGPGRSAPQVSSHQRARIRRAMIEIAAEHGYDGVTVRRLARLAGVSTHSFYDNFGKKEECFLNTFEWLVRRTARRMVGSQRAGRDWRQRLLFGLRALTQDLADNPKAARLLLVEAFAVGPLASKGMSRAVAIFEAVVKASLADAPEEATPPPFASRAIVAGTTTVARSRLLAGRGEELPELVDELMAWALSFACGDAAGTERRGRGIESSPSRDIWRQDGEDLHRRIRGDERALILAAVARLAASDGYVALSLPRVCATAGVSRRSFHAHFDGVEDCFLDAVDRLSTEALSDAAERGATADTWSAGLHRGVVDLCERIRRDRVFPKVVFLEGMPPSTLSVQRHERLTAVIAQRLRNAVPASCRPSKLMAEASVGAVWDSIHRQVAGGRAGRMPQQAEGLTFLLLAPAIGGAAATDVISAEAGP